MKQDHPSILRASSLNAAKRSEEAKHTISINFKNSLFNKMNANSVFLDDHSQLDPKESLPPHKAGGPKKKYDYFDTSSSSSSLSEEEAPLERNESKRAIDIQKEIYKRQIEILGDDARRRRERSHDVQNKRGRNSSHIKDNFEDELLGDKYTSVLSRRDLSSN